MEMGNALFGHSRGECEVSRGLQDLFCGFLESMGFDGYGFRKDHDGFVFENDVFRIHPYWWNECQCPGWDSDEGASKHLPDCFQESPNFTFKPTGLTISWYKYPFRDSYSSEPLDARKLARVMEACAASLDRPQADKAQDVPVVKGEP